MKKCLVIDHGLFTAFAQRLAEDFEVFYFVPYADRSFPKHGPAMVGTGIPGVERIEDMWRMIDEVDFIVFPDVGFYQLASWLADRGYNVWGAKMGEKLEVQRWRAKETMSALGLPVGKCELVTGMSALRDYLGQNEDVFVKISGFRGLAETFHSKNWMMSEQRLTELQMELGGAANVFPFVVEHMVDSVVEAGYDGYCIDGKFPSTCLTGVEVKDRGYLGAVRDYKKLSEPVKIVNQKLSPFLKEARYRQFFSTEIRVTEDGTPYLIDLTTRCPAPPSALFWEMIENVGEIIEGGSEGDLVEPTWRAKYGALAIIKSDFAAEKWCAVEADPSVRQWVKWRNYAHIDGQDWIIPTEGVKMTEIGDVIGIGDTIEEAIKSCQEHAEKLSGFEVKVSAEAIPEALSEIEKAEENNIIFTEDKLPDLTKLIKL
jgi:hypothetical protein